MRTSSLLLVLTLFAATNVGCANKPTQESIADLTIPEVTEVFDASEKRVNIFSKTLHKIGIGKPPLKKPTKLNLQIFTAKNLNAGNGEEPLSLVLKTYLLTSPTTFNELPFEAFLDDEVAQEALGNTFVMQREAILTPGQLYDNTPLLPAEARYIGFVALFRHPSPERWRFTYNIRSSAKPGINLGVHACSFSSVSGLLINNLPTAPSLISTERGVINSPLNLQQRLSLGQ